MSLPQITLSENFLPTFSAINEATPGPVIDNGFDEYPLFRGLPHDTHGYQGQLQSEHALHEQEPNLTVRILETIP